jgi:hypothetical protein
MRKRVVGFCVFVFLAWMSHSTLLAQTREDSLKKFLQNYDHDRTTLYSRAFVDLSSDRKDEAIVYLTGSGWCGSGGCNMLVLTQEGDTWRLVTSITITWPPIRVLASTSHGWYDISVWVRGGGIRPGYEAELSFDGKTYATNPSVPPARPLAAKVDGKVVIPSSEGAIPLYP